MATEVQRGVNTSFVPSYEPAIASLCVWTHHDHTELCFYLPPQKKTHSN